MRRKKWIVGIRAIAASESVRKFLLPKEVTNGRSVHFEEGYYFLWWYFYKIRTCDRCGKNSCGKGLIRYWDTTKSKVIMYLCVDCAKTIPETKNAARRHCRRCSFPCDITYCKTGRSKRGREYAIKRI